MSGPTTATPKCPSCGHRRQARERVDTEDSGWTMLIMAALGTAAFMGAVFMLAAALDA